MSYVSIPTNNSKAKPSNVCFYADILSRNNVYHPSNFCNLSYLFVEYEVLTWKNHARLELYIFSLSNITCFKQHFSTLKIVSFFLN